MPANTLTQRAAEGQSSPNMVTRADQLHESPFSSLSPLARKKSVVCGSNAISPESFFSDRTFFNTF
jgi:hypothetical protein